MKRCVLFELVLGGLATCAVSLRWLPGSRKRPAVAKALRVDPKLLREEQRQRPTEARN